MSSESQSVLNDVLAEHRIEGTEVWYIELFFHFTVDDSATPIDTIPETGDEVYELLIDESDGMELDEPHPSDYKNYECSCGAGPFISYDDLLEQHILPIVTETLTSELDCEETQNGTEGETND